MIISTMLAALVAIKWGYNPLLVFAVNGAFLLVDFVFFSANATKLIEGGWFPLLIAGSIAFLMLTWREGLGLVEAVRAAQREDEGPFLASLAHESLHRMPGAAAFLSASPTGIPLALTQHLRHNRALQERVLLVSLIPQSTPHILDADRTNVTSLAEGFQRVVIKYGFMEQLDIPAGLAIANTCVPSSELGNISYYIGHETVIASAHVKGMAPWREELFVAMQRNTTPTGSSFCIPSQQAVEIGMEIVI